MLWLGKNGYLITSHTVVWQVMYKGRCAECNAHWHSKAFKPRPAGCDVPVAKERRLSFAFESAQNNKICKACYLKNYKALKQSRDEQIAGDISGGKKLRLDEGHEKVNVSEKEGTAISVLLCLLKS